MSEILRKTLLVILLSFFILIVVLVSHFFLQQIHDLNYKIICFEYFYGINSPFPFWTNKFVPIGIFVFYFLMVIICSLGIIIAIKGLKVADLKSLLLMSVIILLILLVLTINQLRLYFQASCPA